jgi:uncharacterized protein YciI
MKCLKMAGGVLLMVGMLPGMAFAQASQEELRMLEQIQRDTEAHQEYLQKNYGLTKEQSRYVTSGQFNKDLEDMANTYGTDGSAKILRDGMDK